MQNCGVRRLPLDFRDQYFGCEIELTGINRATAAQTLADLFGTRAEHSGGGYDAYRVKDLDGKEWKIVRDGSIHPEGYRRSSTSGEYKVELNSPKLEYAEMEKLQEVIRSLRRAGGRVNSSCGMHVHVDASKHTPQSLKNVLSIMYSKEDILFAALKVNPARIDTMLAIQSDNQAYKQAGNGVTVNVIEAIGRRIAKMDAELRGEALAP